MQKDDEASRQELERQLERAKRLAAVTTDRTTYERIRDFAADLRQRLQRLMSRRRGQDEIRARARELWEEAGRPAGHDLDFWLQAERDLANDDTINP
jgi:translation initiation factor 2 beta subunit (eIF-2beta)/eIF-5